MGQLFSLPSLDIDDSALHNGVQQAKDVNVTGLVDTFSNKVSSPWLSLAGKRGGASDIRALMLERAQSVAMALSSVILQTSAMLGISCASLADASQISLMRTLCSVAMLIWYIMMICSRARRKVYNPRRVADDKELIKTGYERGIGGIGLDAKAWLTCGFLRSSYALVNGSCTASRSAVSCSTCS